MVDAGTGRSYAQINVQTLRRAISTLNPSERDVLDFIVSCANARNIAFPGIAKIANGCDLRVPDTMKIIDMLVRGKWIAYARKDECDPLTGIQLHNAYMVTPDYLVLNPRSKHYKESMALAQKLFHSPILTNEESSDSKTTANFGIGTTDRNHRQEPPPLNHRQEPSTEPPPKEPPQKILEGGVAPKTGGNPNDSNADGQQSNVDQPGQAATAHSEAQENPDTVENGKWRVPPPPDGYALPLHVHTAETLALKIYDAVAAVHGAKETSIAACRRLVDNYHSSASHALKTMFAAQAKGTQIRDAMAWITATTKRHYQAAQERQQRAAADDGSKYTSGEYADFIES